MILDARLWLKAPLLFALLSLTGAGQALAQEETSEVAPSEAPGPSEPAVESGAQPEAAAVPAETTAVPAETPAASPAAMDDSLPRLRIRNRKAPTGVFGQYRVRLSLARPKFDDGLKFYGDVYGNPSLYPTLAADWFAWDWYVTLGLSFRMGYYTADGYAIKPVEGKAKEDIEESDLDGGKYKDKNAPVSLTLVPLQLALTAEMTPFAKKWIVLDGWVCVERLYFQEVRTTNTEASTKAMVDTSTDKPDSLTNKGWKNGTVIGASANILLNPIDESSVSSMRGSMGLGYIYLSPFMEIVRTTSKEGVSFGRTSLGVGFTFETSH